MSKLSFRFAELMSRIMRFWRPPAVIALGLLSGLSVSTPAPAADSFVAGTEDLPLMPGLVTVEGAGVAFDTPQGRIVEAYAKGTAKSTAVLDFYAKTLPQLGWQVLNRTAYRREGEVLRLELYEERSGLTVRFYLSPS